LYVRLKKQRVNRREGNVNKSKLVQHAFDKCQTTGYKQLGFLQFECDPKYGKYKKTAHVLYSVCPTRRVRKVEIKRS
jgi:hypothetical protein